MGLSDDSSSQQPPAASRVMLKPGDTLEIGTKSEDLVPTDDPDLARKQVAAYPDNPEASFILAVALTRTSRVEEALQEVRRARKLADARGGPAYFDKMIASYEKMLQTCPKDNRIRYGLAWAYYMKAYLLAKHSRRAAQAPAAAANPAATAATAVAAPAAPAPTAATAVAAPAAPAPTASTAVAAAPKPYNAFELAAAAASGTADPSRLPQLKGALERAEPSAVPQIKKYYELALARLDELLAQKPEDIWARVYRAFLKAEYTGNLDEAMATWKRCQEQHPDNPAPYFFLGEGYLKQGNLKECINNVSKAIALRAQGK